MNPISPELLAMDILLMEKGGGVKTWKVNLENKIGYYYIILLTFLINCL